MRNVKCIVLSVLFFFIPIVAFAGNLNDPAAPTSADSAMYTLEDIYNRLDSNIQGTKRSGSFAEPGAAPGQTGHTLDQVYGKAIPTQVAKTGQVTCYDANGVVSCSGTGQDGDLQKGVTWPSPRFSDHGDGTVTDNLTGLIWLKKTTCLGELTWENALTACHALAAGTIEACGLSDNSTAGDWRLPNASEFQSLIDWNTSSGLPAGHPFGTPETRYWSSTTYPVLLDAYSLQLGSRIVTGRNKGYSDSVWPVRGGGQ